MAFDKVKILFKNVLIKIKRNLNKIPRGCREFLWQLTIAIVIFVIVFSLNNIWNWTENQPVRDFDAVTGATDLLDTNKSNTTSNYAKESVMYTRTITNSSTVMESTKPSLHNPTTTATAETATMTTTKTTKITTVTSTTTTITSPIINTTSTTSSTSPVTSTTTSSTTTPTNITVASTKEMKTTVPTIKTKLPTVSATSEGKLNRNEKLQNSSKENTSPSIDRRNSSKISVPNLGPQTSTSSNKVSKTSSLFSDRPTTKIPKTSTMRRDCKIQPHRTDCECNYVLHHAYFSDKDSKSFPCFLDEVRKNSKMLKEIARKIDEEFYYKSRSLGLKHSFHYPGAENCMRQGFVTMKLIGGLGNHMYEFYIWFYFKISRN